MFIKYMNEDASFDALKNLETVIKDIESDIKNCEREVYQIRHSDLLSDEERKELNELKVKISGLSKEYWDLYNSFTGEEFMGYDEDGHEDYSYYVKDPELEKQVRPRMDALRREWDKLEAQVNTIEDKLAALRKSSAQKRHSELEIDNKNLTLQSRKSDKDKMIAELIAANNLDWACEELRAEIAENIPADVIISNRYISKEGDKIWIHVTYSCDLDLERLDSRDLDWDDFDGYSLPDSYAEKYYVDNFIRWYNDTEIDLENPEDGVTYKFDSQYISHEISNDVECDTDDEYADIELDGSYILDLSLKISPVK